MPCSSSFRNLRERSGEASAAIPLPAPAATPAKPFRAEAAHCPARRAPAATAARCRRANRQPARRPCRPRSRTWQQLWAQLVEAVGRASPFTRTYLLEAHPVSFAKNVFTIGFDPEFEDHLGLVDNAAQPRLLQTKLPNWAIPNVQFKFVKAEAPAGATSARSGGTSRTASQRRPAAAAKPAAAGQPPAAPAPPKEKLASVPFNKDDFKNDPLIQKALEIFKGQIVEVRA